MTTFSRTLLSMLVLVFGLGILVSVPVNLAYAQNEGDGTASRIIPCNGIDDPNTADKDESCDYDDIIKLINRGIDFFLVYLVLPICVVAAMYSGWLLLTSGGDVSARKRALGIFRQVVIGLIIILCAWLVVNTLLVAFGLKDGFSLL